MKNFIWKNVCVVSADVLFDNTCIKIIRFQNNMFLPLSKFCCNDEIEISKQNVLAVKEKKTKKSLTIFNDRGTSFFQKPFF
jgi:hypothetical protein